MPYVYYIERERASDTERLRCLTVSSEQIATGYRTVILVKTEREREREREGGIERERERERERGGER